MATVLRVGLGDERLADEWKDDGGVLVRRGHSDRGFLSKAELQSCVSDFSVCGAFITAYRDERRAAERD